MSNNKKKFAVFPIKGLLAVGVVHLLFWLPEKMSKSIGKFVGRMSYRLSAKKRHVVSTNLKIAFPDLNEQQNQALTRRSIEQSGLLLSEFPRVWLGSQGQVERPISEVNQQQLIQQSLQKNPVILVTPHLGNWELFCQWVPMHFPMTGLYSPSKLPQMDQLILASRSKFGGHPFEANGKGVLKLIRNMRKGGLMILLPDQVPQQGAGVYAPFFGKPAYTMTLLHKLVQKLNATLIFGYCVRQPDESRFKIEIEMPTFETRVANVEEFNRGLNLQIEKMVQRHPEQYVWDYKRYKNQADGKNFYR